MDSYSLYGAETDVGRVSPMTQRNASNRFDLPQPLGPTIAVSPGSRWSSVGSTKDLNPESLSRVNFNGNAPPQRLSHLNHHFFGSIGSRKALTSSQSSNGPCMCVLTMKVGVLLIAYFVVASWPTCETFAAVA